MRMKLYGIPNCNTVKKARAWLAENGIAIPFRDFKKQGVSEELLKVWLKQVGWEKLVNRQGTTWRQMPDEAKAAICDATWIEGKVCKTPSMGICN
jgi:arsenate reductase